MKKVKITVRSDNTIDQKTSPQDLVTLLLKNRNLKKESLTEFLDPTDPKKLKPQDFGLDDSNLKQAVVRIQQAINNKENILIYGDYDVDGISAAAVLWQSLYSQGAKVLPFIPDRQQDGYGIRASSFFRFQKEKNITFSLLITVDNGIVVHREIEEIRASGTEVIITDHHLPLDTLPPADLIIHSIDICGCAVSWLLAREFDAHADLGLAALGTVADCMNLTGPNRSLVVHGLKLLRLNPSPGIKKLIQLSGAKQDSLSTYDLGYILGPRINAVGRLSNPTDALRLLCSQNSLQAESFAKTLNDFNKDRQVLQQESLDLAQSFFDSSRGDRLIFAADPSFHPGIIGLIAGRLTEKYYLPTIAISVGDEISKGSCRSVMELNIIESLRQTSDLLIEVGGHAQAAGFSIKTSNINKFKKTITEIINQKLSGLQLEPSVSVDARMKLNAVNLKNYRAVEKLEPFGIGNEQPLFLFKNIRIVTKKFMGANGDHLRLKVDDPDTPVNENVLTDAVCFKKGSLDGELSVGDTIDIIASLSVNTWQGVNIPQLMVKEIIKE